jgi:hypothetical protein
MYSKKLKEFADMIENIRIEIYSGLHIDTEDRRPEIDDELFSIQSKLRDVAEFIECYEDMEIKLKCNCGKEVSIYSSRDNFNSFEYTGCDEENNPIFRCKDCDIYVWG